MNRNVNEDEIVTLYEAFQRRRLQGHVDSTSTANCNSARLDNDNNSDPDLGVEQGGEYENIINRYRTFRAQQISRHKHEDPLVESIVAACAPLIEKSDSVNIGHEYPTITPTKPIRSRLRTRNDGRRMEWRVTSFIRLALGNLGGLSPARYMSTGAVAAAIIAVFVIAPTLIVSPDDDLIELVGTEAYGVQFNIANFGDVLPQSVTRATVALVKENRNSYLFHTGRAIGGLELSRQSNVARAMLGYATRLRSLIALGSNDAGPTSQSESLEVIDEILFTVRASTNAGTTLDSGQIAPMFQRLYASLSRRSLNRQDAGVQHLGAWSIAFGFIVRDTTLDRPEELVKYKSVVDSLIYDFSQIAGKLNFDGLTTRQRKAIDRLSTAAKEDLTKKEKMEHFATEVSRLALEFNPNPTG